MTDPVANPTTTTPAPAPAAPATALVPAPAATPATAPVAAPQRPVAAVTNLHVAGAGEGTLTGQRVAQLIVIGAAAGAVMTALVMHASRPPAPRPNPRPRPLLVWRPPR